MQEESVCALIHTDTSFPPITDNVKSEAGSLKSDGNAKHQETNHKKQQK